MSFCYTRSYRGPLRAVILDWAGTTLDFGCMAPAVVFMGVFRQQGVPITMEQARIPMGAHKRTHIQQITQLDEVRQAWIRAHGSPPTESDVDRMFREFVPMQISCLADYADLVPGCLDALAAFRRQGLLIGSTTGYTGEMMEILLKEAAARGYAPDASVCSTQVPQGRPAPWMCLQNAMDLGVYPMEALVKVGDTIPDILEGLNAGMWTVGLAVSGNEMGIPLEEWQALPSDMAEARRAHAIERLAMAGAHYVVDSIADVPPLVGRINERLARGERP